MSPVMTPMPMDRFLTPEEPIAIPAGFTRSRQELTRGVPFRWPLESDLSLVLLVPTGFAALWREADPDAVVSAATDETQAHTAPRGADPLERPAIRVILRKGSDTVATIPLAAGLSRVTPDGDGGRTVVDLYVAGWLLHAGCMRGPGAYGSFVEVAWRRVERGANTFPLAPIDPHVAARNTALAQSAAGIPGAAIKPRGGYLP
jgi:hypothetical protein